MASELLFSESTESLVAAHSAVVAAQQPMSPKIGPLPKFRAPDPVLPNEEDGAVADATPSAAGAAGNGSAMEDSPPSTERNDSPRVARMAASLRGPVGLPTLGGSQSLALGRSATGDGASDAAEASMTMMSSQGHPLTHRARRVAPLPPSQLPALPQTARGSSTVAGPGSSSARAGATGGALHLEGKQERVAKLREMSQELSDAEKGHGQLIKTVQSMINQRQRQRFASQMSLLRLQLNMKLPAPETIDGGAQAILEKFARTRGVRLDDESSEDDDDDQPRLNAHIPNPTLGSDVKRALLEEVVPSQYQVRLFYKCALTGRPPPSASDSLAVPRIEGLPAPAGDPTSSTPSDTPGSGTLVPRLPGGDAAKTRRSSRAFSVRTGSEASLTPRLGNRRGDGAGSPGFLGSATNPPLVPAPPRPASDAGGTASPAAIDLPTDGAALASPASPSQFSALAGSRRGSQHRRGSRRGSRQQLFITEGDEVVVPVVQQQYEDDAAIRARKLRETRREPSEFAKLRSQDRHAQAFRREHRQQHLRESRKLRTERKARRMASTGQSAPAAGSTSVGSDSEEGGSMVMTPRNEGGTSPNKTLSGTVNSPTAASQQQQRTQSPAGEKRGDPLRDRPARQDVDSVEQFIAALRHDNERFNKEQLEELRRVREAQRVFHVAKQRTYTDLLDSASLRTAPAKKLFLAARKRVVAAAKAKDQAERLDVFYQHIDRVRAVLPLLFRTRSETEKAQTFLQRSQQVVTERDGQQDPSDFADLVASLYPTETLLQTAVVELLGLTAAMFTITADDFDAWVTAKLQCFDDRDREYQSRFRSVEQQFGRDSATEAKFKLTVHTVRGFTHFAQQRPQTSVRVDAERKRVHTQAMPGIKPLWHESFVLHLQNDANTVKLHVLINDAEIAGSGVLSVAKSPLGKAVKQWVQVPGTMAPTGEVQVTLEVYPPVMFQKSGGAL